ncbi:hypothetical protein [Roseateles sp. MS654]|uniref:hypothetical protein n=1 Tax=Roseateles sp. MS654 TaxID=3412685 RepID=UPI003C2F9F4C
MQISPWPPRGASPLSLDDVPPAADPGAHAGATGAATPTPSPDTPSSAGSEAPLIDHVLELLGPRGIEEAASLARQASEGLDLRVVPGSLAASVDEFIVDGNPAALPDGLRACAARALDAERDCLSPSGRLRAFLGASGRAAVNAAHCAARNFASVALPTMARQAVGRAIDLALADSVSETARTLMSTGCLALPALGQAVLLVRDEMRGEATRYSRATRVVLMALPAGAGLLAATTGTLLNVGSRFAEVVLYPLLRDGVQARWPMVTEPDSGPTRSSLALAGLGYAINQLAVSRAFAAAPDVDLAARAVVPGGVVLRGLANWGGEALDLWTLLMLHHACRHGSGTPLRMRVGQGRLAEALRTPTHWDTMSARGSFVAGFNQLYDSLLDERTLARWLRPVAGEAGAAVAADWTTELIAGALTAPTYLFWTDPLHARGIELQTLDEQRRGIVPARQFAGNRAEPALAGGGGPIALTAFRALPEPDHPHHE